MKALNLYGNGDLRYEDETQPVRKEGEVLLKVKACGICGSDLPRVYEKGTYHFPTIIGHEFSGEIVEAEDAGLLGRGAAVFPLLPCGQCDACRNGHYAQCGQYDYYGSRRDGAMSEYLAVKRANLVLMPKGVSYREAAMTEPAAVARHAFGKTQTGPGDTLVIFGAGPIGLILAGWAREAGVEKIVLVARTQARVDFAQKLGFLYAVNSEKTNVSTYVQQMTRGEGAAACVEGTGSAAALEQCLNCTKNFGRVVTMGNPAGAMMLSQQTYWKILRKELSVLGTWNSCFNAQENEWVEAIAAMEAKVLDLESLITHTFSLADYKQAFSLMQEKKEPYCKVMFVNE